MANPLSDRGISDRDYAAAVGTLVGEAGVGAGLQDYQAIADVIANRLDDPSFSGRYGSSIAAQTMRPNEFSTWSPKQNNAYQNAVAGFAAALNPTRAASFSPAIQERVQTAQQALNDVFSTGIARGITQGATFYDNPDVTAMLGTGAFHNKLDRTYGSTIIGEHRFTGPGFRPDQPYDPITYNGMLDAPPAADPYFGDVMFGEAPVDPVPVGQVEFAGNLPDLTPRPDYSSITAGTAFDPLNSISVPDYGPMPDVMSQFDGPTYADITAGVFPGQTDYSVPTQDFTPSVDAYGPAMSEMGQPGVHAGFGEDPYSGTGPDFSAPSLASRMNEDAQFGRASEFAQGIGYRSTDLNDNAIASRLNKELGPQTAPQLATPSLDMQSMYAGDWEDKLGPPQTTPQKATQATAAQSWSDLGMPDNYAPHNYGAFSLAPTPAPAADIPAVTARPASVPSLGPALDIPAPPSIAAPAPDYSGLVGSTYGVGQPLGGFMDAMANPAMASAYGQPVQRAAGFGDLMGATNLGKLGLSNPFSGFNLASLSGLFGGDNGLGGAMVPNGLGGWRQADALDAMSSPDIANRLSSSGFSLGGILGGLFGGGGFGGEGGYYGGGNNGPGSSLGDGSYADKSGYSDNNPQGIL